MDEYKLLKGLEGRAPYAIHAVRWRWRQAARTPAAKAAVEADPLLRLLDDVVQPDLTDDEYDKLRTAIEAQLEKECLEREQPHVQRRRGR